MPETTLRELLERNAAHVESVSDDYFAAVQDGQEPAAVSICCSDSRVSQEGMWSVEEPGWLFTPSTIGNQVWDRHDGQRVVDGSVLYPIAYTDTGVTTVVGHTGCGAVTAALEAVRADEIDAPAGVEKWIRELVPVVEAGLADDRVGPDREPSLVDQLVEYNVDRQVEFLRESSDVPDAEAIYGFVYDFQGVYGDVRGRTYLVNADGETDTDALADLVPEEFEEHVRRLL
ncbi:carbonic anhydrase [Saliphagus sp. LR7]|uniref:carbonic anhydrase n=1 Tax=Saliphagus sp. LR7 TaxID=2282654 RepID=UPI000DF759E4|nr:carbonic anhydrase [Saliphagus sp. LR7]